MVEKLALRFAEAIKRAEPEKTASVAVMKYALEALLNTFFTVCLIAVVGLITGSFGITMMGLGAFIVLRFFSGGLHLSKAAHCSVVSSILISAAPHIPLSTWGIQVTGAASLLLILLFAPSQIDQHARIPRKYFPVLKLVSAAIVGLNFISLSSTIAVVFLIQAVTTIPYKRR